MYLYFTVLHFRTLHTCISEYSLKYGMIVYILKIYSHGILNAHMWFNLIFVLDMGFSKLSFIFFIIHGF